MNIVGKMLFSFLFLGVTVTVGYVTYVYKTQKEAVKGAQTYSMPTPTPTTVPTSAPTIAPSTKTDFSITVQPTPQVKQYGAWYWQPKLDRAQRWMGTNDQGEDIWSDTGDPTPTPIPQQPQRTSGGSGENPKRLTPVSTGTSSTNEVIKEIRVEQKRCTIYSSTDPNIPKCP